jgi:RNA polymerase sigma factor (sigma-70 family)
MAWLYRTCTHLAIDALRRRRRNLVDTDEGQVPERVPCGLVLEHSVHAKNTIVALHARVPEEALEVAVLCRVDGLSHAETAGILEISERTVRRRLEEFDVHAAKWRQEFAS